MENHNLKNNLEQILKYTISDNKKIQQLKEKQIDEVVYNSETGIMFAYNGIMRRIQSCDNKKEIQYYIRNIDFNKDNLFIVFGMGNWGLLDYIVRNSSEESRIILVEINEQVLKCALENYNYSSMFESGKIIFFYENECNNELKSRLTIIETLGWENLLYNIHVMILANYYMYKPFAYEFVKVIKEYIDASIKSLGNNLGDMFNGFSHNYENVDVILKSSDLNELKGKFSDIPAIIVSAGPSLEKNIQYLKDAQDKALIISCDASYTACKINDVKPDIIASIERDEPTYTYYYKGKTFDDDLVLVGPSLLWPKICEEFRGKQILVSRMASGAEGWWADHFENLNFYNVGSSAATIAFKTAEVAGCNPIILIGQDLAYTDNKKHSDITHTEFEGANDASRSDGKLVEDIHGNMILTNTVYNYFRQWFEYEIVDNKQLKVIDATEGGAKIAGTTIMSLKEAIEKYCLKRKSVDVNKCLKQRVWNQNEAITKYKSILDDAKKEKQILKSVWTKTNKYYDCLEKLFETDFENVSENRLMSILKQMQKGNEIIAFIKEQKSIYAFYQQLIKQTITHVKKIGNELTAENVYKNLKLQLGAMYMISESTQLIIEEYDKMTDYLNKKIEERQTEWKKR